MFTHADLQTLQNNVRTLNRAASSEWLKGYKQVTDQQMEAARQLQNQSRALVDVAFSTTEVSRDAMQTVMKAWSDVLFPAEKAQA